MWLRERGRGGLDHQKKLGRARNLVFACTGHSVRKERFSAWVFGCARTMPLNLLDKIAVLRRAPDFEDMPFCHSISQAPQNLIVPRVFRGQPVEAGRLQECDLYILSALLFPDLRNPHLTVERLPRPALIRRAHGRIPQ
jgi:hypothetical protein